MEGMRGTAAPNGASPHAERTGTTSKAMVGGPYTLPPRIFSTFTNASHGTGAHTGWAKLTCFQNDGNTFMCP